MLVDSFLAFKYISYVVYMYSELSQLKTETGIIITLILRCHWLLLYVLAEPLATSAMFPQVFLWVPGGVSCIQVLS